MHSRSLEALKRAALAGVLLFATCEGATGSFAQPAAPASPRLAERPAIGLGSRTGSSIALARIGRELVAYVADSDDGALRVLDADDERELSAFPLEGTPAQVLGLPSNRLAVTLRDASKVAILEGAGTPAWPLRLVRYLDVPSEPIGLARSPGGATFVVTSGWGHALTSFDTETLARRFVVDVGREPRGVAIARDGARAFVSHASGDGLTVVDLARPNAKAWHLDAENWSTGFREEDIGPFERRANNGYAVALSEQPAGRVFLPHALAHTTADSNLDDSDQPVTGYGGGSAGPNEAFEVAVVDEERARPMDFEADPNGERIARITSTNTTCLVPSAAVVQGSRLFVACLDKNRVLELDAGWFHPADMVTRTFDVPAGPVGLASDEEGGRVYVWSQFARRLTVLPAASDCAFVAASWGLPAAHPLDPRLARGREVFFHVDARISGDGRVCASCHPDGRDDGLVWTTPDGPRQTPMLAGRLEGAEPYGWTGASPDVATHLTKTFARLEGTGLEGDDKDALIAWIRSMREPMAPKLAPAELARGEVVFHSKQAGCSGCHGVGGELPDGESHDVRSRARGDKHARFDTPSLMGVGETAPYFHDGRYRSLQALLVASDGKMGHTKQLSRDDVHALETYLRSL